MVRRKMYIYNLWNSSDVYALCSKVTLSVADEVYSLSKR